MTLFDYYLQYMTQVWEGKRPAPEGITLPEDGDEAARIQTLGRQLQAMGMAAFVRACAAQDGTVLPEELFVTESSDLGGFQVFLQGAETPEAAPEAPAQPPEPDPDAGKHAFEVFLDFIAMDDGLVQYLIDVLKRMDRAEFFKLSQITTKLDLDPEEFLYWLAHRDGCRPAASGGGGTAGCGGRPAQRRPEDLRGPALRGAGAGSRPCGHLRLVRAALSGSGLPHPAHHAPERRKIS